jgi:hypothetical protein
MKKTFATIALAMTVLFGATFTQAGIIVGDNKSTCTIDTATTLMGIIVGDYSGGVQCTANTGILVSD